MRYKTLTIIIALVLAICGCQKKRTEKFMPPNDLDKEDITKLPQEVFDDQAVTKEFFFETMQLFQETYSPIISQLGGQLVINGDWEDSTVNAQAGQANGIWTVLMFGGLARRSEITKDGFIMVGCHEIGHHLGGYPFYANSWGSTEGNSDYFAGFSCARYLWRDELEANAKFRNVVPNRPKKECDSVWLDQSDRDLCYRIMMAAKSTTSLLAALTGTTVSFNRKDISEVGKTVESHPRAQCRLDTYMAAAVCINEWDEDLIPGKDLFPNQNSSEAEEIANSVSCSRFFGFQQGLRPLCWYKPQTETDLDILDNRELALNENQDVSFVCFGEHGHNH